MKKKVLTIAVVLAVIVSTALAGGCSGKLNMLTGRWKILTTGDQYGQNQQDMPLSFSVDIFPDGTATMFDEVIGNWKMDGNTFTFTGIKGTSFENQTYAGSFKLATMTDQSSGNTVPQLTIYLTNEPTSVVLEKLADIGPLQSYLRSQKAASAAPATVAPAAPTASPAASGK